MAQVRDESSPSRIELVVLACLSQSRPPDDDEIADALQQLALPDAPDEVVRKHATEHMAALTRRGWVTGDDELPPPSRRRKARTPRTLTDSGKRVLRNAFQVSRAPTWAQVRDRHLPALALGMTPGSDLASRSCTEEAIATAVLGARFGVRDASTPVAVCDALIARALGMPPGKLTLDRIRAHVLARGVDRQARGAPSPDAKGYAAKLATWIACSAVGAAGADPTPRRLARAVARRWVRDEHSPLGASALPSTNRAPVGTVVAAPPVIVAPEVRSGPNEGAVSAPAARDLLEVVRETIPRIGAEGRFGEKVYVSAIWRSIERDRKSDGLSLDHFKRWLVGANRDGWLVLARADLIGAMDAKQVTESEIHDRGATFHFVLDRRIDGSASQRSSHAG